MAYWFNSIILDGSASYDSYNQQSPAQRNGANTRSYGQAQTAQQY